MDDRLAATMRVLVTEDEAKLAQLLRQALAEEGYDVDVAASGEEALAAISRTSYDAILLDVMLPGVNGIETCRRIRGRGVGAPILMLTARDAVEDRVLGLDAGADDYLGKPFALAELLARVRALGRRGPAETSERIAVGALELDTGMLVARRGGTEIELTPLECAILEHLMRNAGRAVSRTELLDHAWDDPPDHNSNVIEVLMRRLREKVDRPFGANSIETVRGIGYRVRRR